MKARRLAIDRFLLEVSDEEFRLIVGALGEISFAVEGFEFQARLGSTPEQTKVMAKDFRQQADESGLEL